MQKKTIYKLLGALGALIVVLFITREIIKTPTPALTSYDNTTVNFGEVKIGDTANIVFKVQNLNEKANLVIDTVVSSCNCTIADFTKTPIGFDETGVINVRYSPKLTDTVGMNVYQEIIVRSNDLKKIKLLTIKGKVI